MHDWLKNKFMDILATIGIMLTIVGLPFGWLWSRINGLEGRMLNAYSKEETMKMIELVTAPIIKAQNEQHETQKELIRTLHELKVTLSRWEYHS